MTIAFFVIIEKVLSFFSRGKWGGGRVGRSRRYVKERHYCAESGRTISLSKQKEWRMEQKISKKSKVSFLYLVSVGDGCQ